MPTLFLSTIVALLAGAGVNLPGPDEALLARSADEDARAIDVLQSLAAQGVSGTQTRLGLMFAFGQGARQDYVHARMWFQLGAESGDAQAAVYRDILSGKMTQQQVVESQALACECKIRRFSGCG